MPKPGASRVSVPSIVAKERKTAAISGGMERPWSETMRNRSVNILTSGVRPAAT